MNSAESITVKATITWVCIKWNGHPPSVGKNDLSKFSDFVLVTDGKFIDVSKFIYSLDDTPVDWFGQNNLAFVPTHWAFINYPT